jgi:hypothetical protein
MELNTEIFYEDSKERFDFLCEDQEWEKLGEFLFDLGQKGYGELEKELMDSMDSEDLQEYVQYQRSQDGGDDNTQER